jgi:hypothetical protein
MATKVKKLHRDAYYRMCARELKERGGLTEYPGDGPFWAECYEMVEEIYGPEDDPLSKYLPAAENRVVSDMSLSHDERMRRIDTIRDDRDRKDSERRARREAAKTPEEREASKRFDQWLNESIQPARAQLDEMGFDPLSLFRPTGRQGVGSARSLPDPVPQPFEKRITSEDVIRARGMGISL